MRPGIPAQLVGRPRSADPREDRHPSLERPRGLLNEHPYRERLREATRTDWRFVLGIGPADAVRTSGHADEHLVRALAPWVASVTPLAAKPSGATPADWVFLGEADARASVGQRLREGFDHLKPGGRLVAALENPHGLHWLADWRPAADERHSRGATLRMGLPSFHRAVRQVGATEVCTFALLPHHEAPRAVVPTHPPCPAVAQMHALDQVWQRATPVAAVTRKLLGVLVWTGLMRRLYPHYLVVARKSC